MHNYEMLGNNKYKTITYGDITYWIIIKLDKHNSKWFKSKKAAYAYSQKHFPETDDAIDDSQLKKTLLPIFSLTALLKLEAATSLVKLAMTTNQSM